MNSSHSNSSRRGRKLHRSSSPGSNVDESNVAGPSSSSESHQRKLAEEELRAQAAMLMGLRIDDMKIMEMIEAIKKNQQIQNAEAEKLKEEEMRKMRAEAKLKRELELKRQQEEQLAKEQEMQKRREMQMMAEIERERRRQHMLLVRAMDIHKRFEERERKREEALQEKKVQQEKKLLKKRIEMELIKELKKPVDDMRLKDLKPLPTLNRIPGLKLPAKAFSDVLMVYEFLHNFGDVIGLESDSLPSLNSFQLALLNMEESAEEEILTILRHLLRTAIESPGLPVNMTTVVGQKLKDAPITNFNVSEILRLYFSSFVIHRTSAAYGIEGKLLKLLSQNKPFLSLAPTNKAEILSYLCNELSCHPAIVKRIEENIESLSVIRRDKWLVDCELRKFKSIKAKREVKRAQFEAQTTEAAEAAAAAASTAAAAAATTTTPADNEKVKDDEDKLKVLADDSGDSGAENEEQHPHVNLDAPDEEPEMSNEEIDKKIEKLTRQCTLMTNKLNKAMHGLRVNALGQDRYRRRYWVLPASGGIFVEGMESGEPEEMEANFEDEISQSEQQEDSKGNVESTAKGGSKNEDEHEKENKMDDTSETSDTVVGESLVKQNGICETIDQPADGKVEKKSNKKGSSKKKKKNAKKSKVTKIKDETTETNEANVKAEDDDVDDEKKMQVDEDEHKDQPTNNGEHVNGISSDETVKTEEKIKDEPEAKTESESTVAKETNGDANETENMDTINETNEQQSDSTGQRKSEALGISHLVASALFSKQQQQLKNNQQQGNSGNNNESSSSLQAKAWFSIIPRISCSTEILPEDTVKEETEISHLTNDHSHKLQNESLANGTLDDSKMNLSQAENSNNAPSKDLLNTFLNGGAENIELSQLLSLEEFSDICPSLQKRLEQQKDEQFTEALKIPLDYQFGWWRLTDPGQIRSLMDCLHERGVRERNLHKHLTKYSSYITTKCKVNAAEFDVTELDRKIFEVCSFGAPRDTGRYSKEAALRLDIAVLGEIDSLEEKIAASSMQVRGWAPSKKSSDANLSFRRSLAPFSIDDFFIRDVPNGEADELEDEEKVEQSEDDEEYSEEDDGDRIDTLSFGKERLLTTEAMIERRYLKPPLGFKSNTILISTRNSTDELADNAADENAPSGLIRWRDAVRECKTTAQLALLTHFLESCIAWDKSIMRAVSFHFLLRIFFFIIFTFIYIKLNLMNLTFFFSSILYFF